MHLNSIILIFVSSLLINSNKGFSQESINSGGGNGYGINGSCSFSIGQLTYNTYYDSENSVSEGVQQPYEIQVIAKYNSSKNDEIHCFVYPNPTSDFIKLSISSNNYRKLMYSIYDIKGNTFQYNSVNEKETELQLSSLSSGTYYLTIYENSIEIKTFKIIKNK